MHREYTDDSRDSSDLAVPRAKKWPVVTFSLLSMAASVGGSWGVAQYQAGDHERRISALEGEQRSDHDVIMDIKNDVKWIVRQMGGRPGEEK